MKNIEITHDQALQFNKMLVTLSKIANEYQTPDELQESSEEEYGLDYEEALGMAYENIQGDAEYAIKGVELIKIPKD